MSATPRDAGTVVYDAVGFAYPGPDDPRHPPALVQVDLAITAGEVVLVIGGSGSGKSTLLRCANGLVPHSSGGRFSGSVLVGNRSTRSHKPRELADLVGFVHQDPEAQFVVDHVETDLAFVLENLGTDAHSMRRRVEEVLDALAIAHLRDRSPATLSGGERQRCAIAGALASAPASRRGYLEIALDEAAQAQWLGVLNDARLALGTALDITEDTELDHFDDDDPRRGSFYLYSALTALQGELIEALLSDL